MKKRLISERIKELKQSRRGRILALTGARQTGKSTLLKALFPKYKYISLDDPATRNEFQKLTTQQLIKFYPSAIFDEVQKAPKLFDLIKSAHDASDNVEYILSGSSQILLMKNISESLAGRSALLELYPLTIKELLADSENITTSPGISLIISLILKLTRGTTPAQLYEGLNPVISNNREYIHSLSQWHSYLQTGGMPAITHYNTESSDKVDWLRDYNKTYLQRDIIDLSKTSDLEYFVDAQKALAARSGKLVNYSDFARIISVSPAVIKRFLRYLEISYQVLKLPAWHKNTEKRLIKMPKVLFIDPGICRALLNRTGDITGEEFEAAVAGEMYKQCKCANLHVDFYHLRTFDNREIDLLLEFENGYIAVESKLSDNVVQADGRHFRGLQEVLDKPFLGGLILSNNKTIGYFPELNVLSLPAAFAFGASAI